jgi:hypothetical protein
MTAAPFFVGVAGDSQEHVVEIRRVKGDAFHIDRLPVEPIEQGANSLDVPVARDLQGERVIVADAPSHDTGRRCQSLDVGELQADVPAGDETLEIIGRATAENCPVTPITSRTPSGSRATS